MRDKTAFSLLLAQRFLLGFTAGFLLYILSRYFETVSTRENVGVFFWVISLAVLVILLVLHRIIARVGRVRLSAK